MSKSDTGDEAEDTVEVTIKLGLVAQAMLKMHCEFFGKTETEVIEMGLQQLNLLSVPINEREEALRRRFHEREKGRRSP